MNFPRRPLSALLLSGLLLLIPNAPAQAGSATWNLNPTSGNWNKAANWTPATVPNGPADLATFSISNQTSVVLNESAELNQIVFGAGASPFTITCEPFAHFNMTGTGMINNSGINQTFVTTVIEGQRLGVGTSIFSTAPARRLDVKAHFRGRQKARSTYRNPRCLLISLHLAQHQREQTRSVIRT